MRIISESIEEDALLEEIAQKSAAMGVCSVRTTTLADAVGVSVWGVDDVTCSLRENADRNLRVWMKLSIAEKISIAQQLFKPLLEASTEDVFIGIRGSIEDLLDD